MFYGVAEEAMKFYVSLFKGSEIRNVERYGRGEQGAEGSIKIADFTVGGQHSRCIDSPVKHAFSLTPSISIFFIDGRSWGRFADRIVLLCRM
jgi:predicted 3-demethylubiquinone-9 3-methyltransferase (glyoxalase superfamily)